MLLFASNTNGTSCENEHFVVSSDFPGGSNDDCVATNFELRVSVKPEDEPPINPSPWYGFRIDPKESTVDLELRIVLEYPPNFEHRYVPKISTDGKNWKALDLSLIDIDDEGKASFEVSVGSAGLYVLAQENLNWDWYSKWFVRIQEQWPGSRVETIGYSHAKWPIRMFESNPGAEHQILLLGRSHPPEIPGAESMREFVDVLAAIRTTECSQGMTSKCRWFERTNFLVIPLLNPDGVALGHWRHNLGSKDLNRDWGEFEQPETRSVQRMLVQRQASNRLQLMLDFHSTNRDVLYVQLQEDETFPNAFTSRWFDAVRERLFQQNEDESSVAGFEIAPRATTDNGTSKNYFYRTYGIPAITFETGDNTTLEAIVSRVPLFAQAMVDVFLGDMIQSHQLDEGDACSYAFKREVSCEDFFCFMIETNKATLVVLDEANLLKGDLASIIARALLQVSEEGDQDDLLRHSNYLPLEERLIEIAGLQVSDIHIGRSRQDLHGTVRRMLARSSWLQVVDHVLGSQQALLGLAEGHIDTVIPAYTHGVPSQPTTFAHQLLAYSASLDRLLEKLQEGFTRLNRSPYGAGAGTTSSYGIDREQLAHLLGFSAPVENSFDANFVDSMEFKIEFASVLSGAALTINQFVENLHSQQRDPLPWLYLGDESVSSSTSMPQKRNPRDLDRIRTQANNVLALGYRLQMNSHNVDAGMHDYRMAVNVSELTQAALTMFSRFKFLMDDIVVDPIRAREAVDRSFATSTQLAELMFEASDLSFRESHGFAAKLVAVARTTDRKLNSLTQSEIESVYSREFEQELPVSVEDIQKALDASHAVNSKQGLGGPQPTETQRMLNQNRIRWENNNRWYLQTLTTMTSSDVKLQDAFFDLCAGEL